MPKKKHLSLSEQISALNNPTPTQDPEDFWDEETSAKVADYADDEEEDNVNLATPNSLRKKTAHRNLQADLRYIGQKTSRRDWLDESDNQFDDEDENDVTNKANKIDEDEKEEDDFSDDDNYDDSDELQNDNVARSIRQRIMEKKFKELAAKMNMEVDEDLGVEQNIQSDEDDYLSDDDEEEEDKEDGDESGDDDGGEEEEEYEEEEEDNNSEMRGFSSINISEEVEKGTAVRAQLCLWDSLMETRIKMQKALTIANQLPQHNTYELFMKESGEEVQAMMRNGETEVNRLVQVLVKLQEALLDQNPETRHVLSGEQPDSKTNECINDNDEEIPSDTDDEDQGASITRTPKTDDKLPRRKRKRVMGDLGQYLAKRHKNFESYRNMTIQKWFEKTKLSTGKLSSKSFSGFERSALVQIQQILQDHTRLVQRTQLKRSGYQVLGQMSDEMFKGKKKTMTEDEAVEDLPMETNQHLKNYDPEIFDDDDFYHQLLRELIEKRTSATMDPIQLTRQWLQVQKLRSKVKRIVDTKASKGRKLRYDVHQKLVSFMAPIETSTVSNEARNELYKSLFGHSAEGRTHQEASR